METQIDTDISARTFWAKPFEEREQSFAWLRTHDPVSYHRPYESTLLYPDEDTPGFWAVWKYEDCREVSRDTSRFTSAFVNDLCGGPVMEDFPIEIAEATQSFLSMDGPQHARLRGIVSQAFTPRRTKMMEDWIHEVAREVVDEMVDLGEGDFCKLVAALVPGRIFAQLFGVDPRSEEAHILMDAAEKMLAWDDPVAANGRDALMTYAEEAARIQEIALEVAEKRALQPADDMVSWVVNAEWDGEKMDEMEIAAFFSLLGSAANDTTRHTMAHTVRLIDENPDQKALLLEDLDGRLPNAVEEGLRHATSVMHFRRTALVDTQLHGVDIKKGDKVVMWYCSGDRDEDQFPNSAKFDILRPNAKTHLAFGAGGPHFCIGAALGRTALRAALTQVYTRIPDIRLDGPPEFQVNNFMHGVNSQPMVWTPPKD